MKVAIIRGSPRQREHIITQPEHRTPGPERSPVSHWTLCNRIVYHGPQTEIRGPIESRSISCDGPLCRRCERAMDFFDMAERYAESDYVTGGNRE